MLENILDREVHLKPVKLQKNQIHCDFCGGIGWVLKDEKWLATCPHCRNGAIDCCPRCGKPYSEKYRQVCDNPKCIEEEYAKIEKEKARKEAERYAKAEHVEPDGAFERYTMLYSEYYPYDNGYFIGWDEFFDQWSNQEEPEIQRPEYVWATEPIEMSMDAYSIIESATYDLWEGAMDSISDKDIKDLQKYLDEWCKEQTGTKTYYVDYSKAVRIPWEEY